MKIETVDGQKVPSRHDPCGFSRNVKVNLKNDALKNEFLKKLEAFDQSIRFVSEKELVNKNNLYKFFL